MALPGPALIGRDAELAVLEALVAGVAAGRGGAVLVEGEPGIGKTALLEAGLAGAQAHGCQVLRGACDELTQRFPLSAMLGALGAHAADASPGLSGPGEAAGLGALLAAGDPVMAAVEQLVGLVDRLCADGPVVLVVEDLHWADEASLVLLHRLTRLAAQLPLLLAVSCRPVPAPPGLSRLRAELRKSAHGVLALDGLSADEVARLARELVGRPPGARLAEHLASASGNPFYVRELIDALVRSGTLREQAGSLDVEEEGPAREAIVSLARVIVDRLDSLTAETRQTLMVAALLGPVFSVADLSVVAGRAPIELLGAIEEAVAAGVVEAGADEARRARLRFRHGLLRQSLYASMPLALRVALHQQAIGALIAADAPAERVAELLLPVLGEADGWELDWIVENGGALINRAPEIAAQLLEHALVRLDPGDPRRPRTEDALLPVTFYLNRFERTERLAQEILATSAEPERTGHASWFLVRNLVQQGRPETVDAVTQALAGDRLSELWRARLTALRSTALGLTGRGAEARQEAESALAEGVRLADVRAQAHALLTLSLLGMLDDDPAGACAHAERALEAVGGDPELTDLRLLIGSNRFAWLGDLDRFDEAQRSARGLLALAEQSWTSRLGSIRVRFAEMAYTQGRWDDASAELEQAAEMRLSAQMSAVMHAFQALIAGHRDDGEAAARHFSVLAQFADSAPWVHSTRPVVLARLLEAERSGSAERVIDVLAPYLTTGEEHAMAGWQLLLPEVAKAAAQVGRDETLRLLNELVKAPISKERMPERWAGVVWCEGLLTDAPGPVLAAAAYFRESGRLPWLGRALEDAAVLHATTGDLASARQTLAEALEVYAELGAVWDTRRALSRMRRYGVRPGVRGARRRPKTGWQALTDTEVRVAQMVARGLSNPDIAGQLQLSRRTVETHVSHILTKLQVSSRREVAEHA